MEKKLPKLIWREGTREIWETEQGFTVITPFGCFECPDRTDAEYVLNQDLVTIRRKEGSVNANRT